MFQNLENNFLPPPKVSSNSCYTGICGLEESANTKQQLSELLLRVRSQLNSFSSFLTLTFFLLSKREKTVKTCQSVYLKEGFCVCVFLFINSGVTIIFMLLTWCRHSLGLDGLDQMLIAI